MKTFSPQLNVRTSYNFQESVIKLEDYVAFAVRHKFPYLFYADKFVMYGAADFTALANQNQIKPIIGLTLEINGQIVILIATNYLGYRDLSFISSLTIDQKFEDWLKLKEVIKPHLSTNLIGVVNWNGGEALFKTELGASQIYFLEYLPTISYLYPEQKESLDAVLALKKGTTIAHLGPIGKQHYFSNQEIEALTNFENHRHLLDKIANRVNFNLLTDPPVAEMLIYPTNSPLKPSGFLAKLTSEALGKIFAKNKLSDATKQKYENRLDYELNVIHEMGFDSYFLIVWDYVKYARDHGILVGPGRGSAAGSLVSYLLGITAVDPIEYDLYFERFLNPERKSLPDIDIDFQDDRRGEVVEYLAKKYGKRHMALISTFQTIGAKLAIRDAGRVLGINLDDINIISKNLSNNLPLSGFEQSIKRSKILQAYVKDYPELFKIAKDLIGLPRQTGTHAAGVVLSQTDLRNFVPLKLNYEGFYQTQYDMTHLEAFRLIKMDLLGLKNLSILKMIEENIYKNRKQHLHYEQLPLNDQATYRTLNQKQTSGIFQLESPGMTRVVQQVQVNSINDISDVSALFRPGPQEMIPEYVANKKSGHIPQDKVHQALAFVLKDTHGVMVYQEQVLQALQKIANFSLGKADIVRRAMSKKDRKEMRQLRSEFLQAASKNGYRPDDAQEIWNWIDRFAGYGFNKSHSLAYSYLSYWLAYYKTHYPVEFYGALLTNAIGNEIKTAQYLQEAQALNLPLKFPNLKNMSFGYTIHNNSLYLPLTLIKGISYEFIRKLKEQYAQDKNLFKSIFYLMSRLVNNGLTITNFPALVWAGAFDFFGYNRATLIANQKRLFDFAQMNANSKVINEALVPEMDIVAEDKEQAERQEKKYLGFSLRHNALGQYRDQFKLNQFIPISQAKTIFGTNQKIFGEIVRLNIKDDSHHKPMAHITFKDETGYLEGTLFSSIYPKYKDLLKPNNVLVAHVNINDFNGKPSARIRALEKIDLK